MIPADYATHVSGVEQEGGFLGDARRAGYVAGRHISTNVCQRGFGRST